MTFDEIKMAQASQLEARVAQITKEAAEPNCDAKSLNDEMQAIETRMSELKANAESRNHLLSRVGQFGVVVETGHDGSGAGEQRTYDASSVEFRNAWLKDMATMRSRNRVEALLGEMTTEERAAFTHLTTNTPNLVPTPIINRIIELVESKAPMYEDSTKSAFEQGFSVPRHTAIEAGDATVTEEGVANDDEEDAFSLLTLDGVELKKHIKLSRKMKFKSIDAFEDWIVKHLADRIAVAKEALIRTRLSSTTTGIAADNVKTGLAYSDENILSLFGLLRGEGAKCIYADATTIWNFLAKIRNVEGDKIFVPNSNADPIEGRIYGAEIKIDNAIPTHTIYLGYPEKILSNNYDDLTIASDTNIETWVETISAYSLFDAALENPLSFVKATFDPEAQVAG